LNSGCQITSDFIEHNAQGLATMKTTIGNFQVLMMRILSFVGLLLVFIMLSSIPTLADSYYTIDSGDIDYNNNIDPYSNGGPPLLVRWPNGILHSTHAEQYGTTQEIYWDYSFDDGLNWSNVRLTTVGHEQKNPVIAQSSNWDLHFVFVGRGGGNYPNTYALKYIWYDYSEDTLVGPVIIHDANTGSIGDGDINAQVMVDGDDNIIVVFGYWDTSPTNSSKIYYVEKLWNGSDWGSWNSVEEVASSSTSNCVLSFSAAIDKDNNVGVVRACVSNGLFWQRYYETGTWSSSETFDSSGSAAWPALMASISGGETVWRCVYHSGATISYNQRASGAWGSPVSTGLTTETYKAIAQEHGTGDGDTGNFYAITGDSTGFRWVKYTLGAGWGTPDNDTTRDAYFIGGTKALFPYSTGSDWHWNLPATDFAAVFTDDNGNGFGDGDELVRFYMAGDDWGSFPPSVTTGTPTNITQSTATFHGSINYTGGDNPTTIGWQYGHTQTATWTESLSGNFSVGDHSAPITGLSGDEIYYCRFYAINSEGTSYGDWIGFITAQPSYDTWPDDDDDDVDLVPPLPDEPPGWYKTNVTFSNLPGTSIFNEMFNTSGYPIAFFWYLMLAMFITFVTICAYFISRGQTLVVFLVGSVALGFFCSVCWLDWWMMVPWLIVGITSLTMERQPMV
jgi:hypothetical protein